MVKVFWGKQELGEVDQMTFATRDDGPALLTLGGRSWQTTYVDWPRKKAYVEPTDVRGKSQWLSGGQPMSYELSRSIADVLTAEDIPDGFSSRAQSLLETLRESYGWLEFGKSTLLFDGDGNAIWWNFASKLLNTAMKNVLTDKAEKITADNLCLVFRHIYGSEELKTAILCILSGEVENLAILLDEDFIKELKFSECLSQREIDRELSERYSVDEEFERFRLLPLTAVKIAE
jgi:ATP-dependent Lhr-like helicase